MLRRPAAVAVALALALRLAALASAARLPGFHEHVMDSAFYDDMARQILADGLLMDGPFLMAPLYGYVLAAFYAVFGPGPLPVALVQCGLGAATAGLASRLGDRLGGVPAAWVAGLGVALDPVLALYDTRLLSVSLTVVLSTWAALALLEAWSDGRGALRAGLLIGLAATARANLLLAMPVLALLFAVQALKTRRLRPVLALLVGMAAPLSLPLAHNLVAGGVVAPVAVNGGINLYRGNNAWFVDEAVHPFPLPAERDALATKARLVASVSAGRWLDWAETDQYWIDETLLAWRAHPGRALGLLLRKTHQVLRGEEIGDNLVFDVELARTPPLGWLPNPAGLLAVLGLVGLVARGRRTDDAPLVALVVVGVGSVALFFVVSRYCAPLVPLWAAYAGATVSVGVGLARARRWGLLVGGSAGAGCLAALLALSPTDARLLSSRLAGPAEPLPCSADPHPVAAPEVEDAYRAGTHALLAGRADEARAAFEQAWARDPTHAATGVSLSYLYLAAGQLTEAEAVARATATAHPCDEKAWANLGTALGRRGDRAGAVVAFAAAREIDRTDPGIAAALGEAQLGLGRVPEGLTSLRFAMRWGPDLWQPRVVLGRVALREGRYEEARGLLGDAASLAPEAADVLALRGLAELAVGDVTAAGATLAAARVLDPEAPAVVGLDRALTTGRRTATTGERGGE